LSGPEVVSIDQGEMTCIAKNGTPLGYVEENKLLALSE
jgi:hypothetical protein